MSCLWREADPDQASTSVAEVLNILYDQALHLNLHLISEPCCSHSGASLIDVTELDQHSVAELGANGAVVIELLGSDFGFHRKVGEVGQLALNIVSFEQRLELSFVRSYFSDFC